MAIIYLFQIFWCLAVLNILKAEVLSRQQQIWNAIRSRPEYSFEISPVNTEKLNVTVTMSIFDIVDLNEPQESITTAWMASLTWVDPRLSWNPEDFDGWNYVNIPTSAVYLPDISITNSHNEAQKSMIFDRSSSRVNILSDGTMSWFTMGAVTTSCSLDLAYYPFDYQTCFITIECISQMYADMRLLPNTTDMLAQYRSNSIWDVVDANAQRHLYYWGDELKFYIRLRRKPLYFMFNIGAPVIILSALTVLTFCLPNGSGEKLSFVATVFLSFMVLTNQIATSLPTSSDTIPLLGLYAFVSVIYAALANVATVAVLAVHDTAPGEQPHVFLMTLLRLLDRLCIDCLKSKSTAVHSTQQTVKSRPNDVKEKSDDELNTSGGEFVSNEIDWAKKAAVLDTCFFWLFLVANLVTIIVFLVIIPNVNRCDYDGDNWLAQAETQAII